MYTNGRLDVGGVPSLRDLLVDVTKDIPEGQSTVYDAWRASEWTRQDPARRQIQENALLFYERLTPVVNLGRSICRRDAIAA